MRHNFKIHAIAITSITAIVVLVYLVSRPSTQPAVVSPFATGDRYVRIDSADWGLNCNTEIQRLITAPPAPKSVDPKPSPSSAAPERPTATAVAAPLELATPNNVTLRLSDLCNGRMVCTQPVTAQTMALDPLPSCFKELHVSYRCFSIDRLWHQNYDQGDTMTIDCNEEADKDRI